MVKFNQIADVGVGRIFFRFGKSKAFCFLLFGQKVYAHICSVDLKFHQLAVACITGKHFVPHQKANRIPQKRSVLVNGTENPVLEFLSIVESKHGMFFVELDSEGFLVVLRRPVYADLYFSRTD